MSDVAKFVEEAIRIGDEADAELARLRSDLAEAEHCIDDLITAILCNNRTEAEIAVHRANTWLSRASDGGAKSP